MTLIDKLEAGIGSELADAAPASAQMYSAAVLVAITRHPRNPLVVLTRRADHLKYHSGEVAFPGGKWEARDMDLASTALRETEEEIGLRPGLVELKGVLPQRISRLGVAVTPFVGLIPNGVKLYPNPSEIEAIFYTPLRFFLETPADSMRIYNRYLERHISVPAWRYQGFEIWGLTALFIQDLLNELEDFQS